MGEKLDFDNLILVASWAPETPWFITAFKLATYRRTCHYRQKYSKNLRIYSVKTLQTIIVFGDARLLPDNNNSSLFPPFMNVLFMLFFIFHACHRHVFGLYIPLFCVPHAFCSAFHLRRMSNVCFQSTSLTRSAHS